MAPKKTPPGQAKKKSVKTTTSFRWLREKTEDVTWDDKPIYTYTLQVKENEEWVNLPNVELVDGKEMEVSNPPVITGI